MKESNDFSSNKKTTLKLSCIPISFFNDLISGKMSFYELAKLCSKFGLLAVDLGATLLGEQKSAYLISIHNQIQECGIKIAGIMAYPDFVNPNYRQRKKEIVNLKRIFESANILESEFVRITTGQNYKELTKEKGIDLAVTGIMNAIEIGKNYNIKLLYEHHAKPSVWQYPDFNLPTDIFLEIFKAIKNLDISIIFDTANPLVYGDDPFIILESVYNRVECVHISDIKTLGKQEMVVIGTGIVPIKSILTFLNRNKYNGWISIEEASHTGTNGLKRAVSFIKETWMEIHNTL